MRMDEMLGKIVAYASPDNDHDANKKNHSGQDTVFDFTETIVVVYH